MTAVPTDPKRIRDMAERCGLRLEKPRDPRTCDGWTYVLWNGSSGVGANTLAELEAYLRRRFPNRMPREMRDWSQTISATADIVDSYDTMVTLRQLFYQLVSRQMIRNSTSDHNYLSKLTAEARRDGWFPDLIDQTSEILVPRWFSSTQDAMAHIRSIYRRDGLRWGFCEYAAKPP